MPDNGEINLAQLILNYATPNNNILSKTKYFLKDFGKSAVNERTKGACGYTPLISAVITNRPLELVDFLLENQANPNKVDLLGCSALHYCIGMQRDKIHDRLIGLKETNLDLKSFYGKTPLYKAITTKNYAMFKSLLEHKASLYAQDHDLNTALHHSVSYQNFDMVKLILDKNTNFNSRNKHGCTPMHIAVEYKNTQLIKMMLESKKFDIKIKNNDGHTPIHLALELGYQDITKLLLGAIKENNLDEGDIISEVI
ncbi:MAG TPA: ankyrin repeat domain-containing protein [Candidatus Megaira endosymbiont of Nemacystus decipiens]|nr:ankyrin repeat domain-containing protein [Candidatus Megaera endosymbiont of Nemacystus decipiens]